MDVIKQAKKILKEAPDKELGLRMGLKPSNFCPLRTGKRPLTEKMATRICEAYFTASEKKEIPGRQQEGVQRGPKPEPAKPALEKSSFKVEKAPKYAPNNHPAWAILEQYTAEEIAASCGVTLKTIEGTADNGMTGKLADLIVKQFIPLASEEHMEEAMRAVALRDDGEIPQLREKLENEEAESKPLPVKSWVDPNAKKGQSLPPSLDLFRQLLAVKGAFLVVPLEGLGGGV